MTDEKQAAATVTETAAPEKAPPPEASGQSLSEVLKARVGTMPTELLKAINDVMRQVRNVEKTGNHPEQGWSYLETAHLISALHDHMTNAGLGIIPDEKTAKLFPINNGKGLRAVVTMDYTIWHISGEFICMGSTGIAHNYPGDKAIYSAKTGALKYMLQQLFLIAAGEDPEAQVDNVRYDQQGNPRAAPPKQDRQPPAQQQNGDVPPPVGQEQSSTVSLTAGFNPGNGRYMCDSVMVKESANGNTFGKFGLRDAHGKRMYASWFDKRFMDVALDMGLHDNPQLDHSYAVNFPVATTIERSKDGKYINITAMEVLVKSPRAVDREKAEQVKAEAEAERQAAQEQAADAGESSGGYLDLLYHFARTNMATQKYKSKKEFVQRAEQQLRSLVADQIRRASGGSLDSVSDAQIDEWIRDPLYGGKVIKKLSEQAACEAVSEPGSLPSPFDIADVKRHLGGKG